MIFLHIRTKSFLEPKQILPTAAEKMWAFFSFLEWITQSKEMPQYLNKHIWPWVTVQLVALLALRFKGTENVPTFWAEYSAHLWLVEAPESTSLLEEKRAPKNQSSSSNEEFKKSLKRNRLKCFQGLSLHGEIMDENFYSLYFSTFLQGNNEKKW